MFWLILSSFTIYAQNEKESVGDKFENLKDFFTVYPNKTKVEKDSTLYLSKLIIAPITVSYTHLTLPTTSRV